MSYMIKEKLIFHIVEQIGFLLNSLDPQAEINKLISMELTLNPDAKEMSYEEILGVVINKLINFYDNKELEELWTHYLLISNNEITDDFDLEDEDEDDDEDEDEGDEGNNDSGIDETG
jgi:hypothetical protein